jgi:hypothetical protein
MTIRRQFSLPTSMSRGFAVALLGALLGGCASSDGTTPVAQRGPINTGTYPNLNVPPQVAAPTMTDVDKARLTGQIASAHSAQAASGQGAGTTGNPVYLKKLAAGHGANTLEAIAGQ